MKKKLVFFIPIFAIGILLILDSGFNAWRHATGQRGTDYFVAWSVSQGLKNGPMVNLYTQEGRHELADRMKRLAYQQEASDRQRAVTKHVLSLYGGKIDTTGTPFLYAAIGMLSTGNYDQDYQNFVVLSLCAFVCSISIQCYLLGYSFLEMVIVMTLFLRSFAPLASELNVGNVNQVQLLMLTLFILSLTRDRQTYHILAGTILGISVMFKPNLSVIVIYLLALLLIRKDFLRLRSTTIGIAIGTIIGILFPWLYFGEFGGWVNWIKTLPDLLHLRYRFETGNYGLSSLLNRWFNINASLFVFGIIVTVYFSILWLTRTRNKTRPTSKTAGSAVEIDTENILAEAFLATGIGCTTTLLSAGLAWLHYFILLIPIILFVIRPTLLTTPRWADISTKTAGFVSVFLLTSFPYALMSTLTGRSLADLKDLASLMVNIAALILLALGLIELAGGRRLRANRSFHVHSDLTASKPKTI